MGRRFFQPPGHGWQSPVDGRLQRRRFRAERRRQGRILQIVPGLERTLQRKRGIQPVTGRQRPASREPTRFRTRGNPAIAVPAIPTGQFDHVRDQAVLVTTAARPRPQRRPRPRRLRLGPQRRQYLITGPCGTGKSWVSCALAVKRRRNFHRVRRSRQPRPAFRGSVRTRRTSRRAGSLRRPYRCDGPTRG